MKKTDFCRLLPAALAAVLLAGCAEMRLPAFSDLTAEVTPSAVETAQPAAAQGLTAYADDAYAPVLEAYAAAQGVELTMTDDASAAALLLVDGTPAPADGLDVGGDTLLAAAAQRAGQDGGAALPLGRSLYGYWADGDAIAALLGETGLTDLQNADYEEWSAFVEALTAWLAEPAETQVTLNGQTHTLPAALPDGWAATGVFAAPLSLDGGYSAALLAAGDDLTADTLAGPLGGVYSAVTLEWDNMAADGAGLFRRGRLCDLLAADGADACEALVLVPFKLDLIEDDLSTEEYNLTGLLNYPVLAPSGYLVLNAAADESAQKAAKSAALWLYSSGEGETALTETLGLLTPWNTASDKTALTAAQAAQIGAGILPGTALDSGVSAALAEAEDALRPAEDAARAKTERAAYISAATEALLGSAGQ